MRVRRRRKVVSLLMMRIYDKMRMIYDDEDDMTRDDKDI